MRIGAHRIGLRVGLRQPDAKANGEAAGPNGFDEKAPADYFDQGLTAVSTHVSNAIKSQRAKRR
jgi:hypothetical protein